VPRNCSSQPSTSSTRAFPIIDCFAGRVIDSGRRVSTTYRPWRRLDVKTFRQELRRRSALCCIEIIPEDVDAMADLYSSECNAIA